MNSASPLTVASPSLRRVTPRQLWDQVSIYLPVLLMGLLALASYWLLRATPEAMAPAAERPVTHEPDYFMHRFSIKVFDASGTLKTEVFGAQARHHPDTDSTEIDQARIRSIRPDGLLTTATAQRVTSNSAQTEFVLQGDAVVVREGGRNADGTTAPKLTFHGEELRVFMEPQRLVSDHPVTLVRGNDRLNADTLDYKGHERVAVFKGRVKAELSPR